MMPFTKRNIFNPFIIDDNRFLANRSDIDPDGNFYFNLNIPDALYVTSEDVLNKFATITAADTFSIFHTNCRSLNNHFDDLQYCLNNTKTTFDIIALTETWTSIDTENNFRINGYKEILKSRNSHGGGVGLYCTDSLNFVVREDLLPQNDDYAECAIIELTACHVIVACIYRPPGCDLALFIDFMDQLLTKINSENKIAYLTGDFNVDLLKSDIHLPTSQFVDCLLSHAFLPVINKPTRITEYSQTLIDNIFTNAKLIDCSSLIICTDISDHFSICFRNCLKQANYHHDKVIYKRSFSDKAVDQFLVRLNDIDWNTPTFRENNNPNALYDLFISAISNVFEECFPVVKVNLTRKHTARKPWITKGLVKSCIKKEKLYKSFKLDPTTENKLKYTAYRNKLNTLIKKITKELL